MAKKKQLPRGLRNNNPLNIRKGAQRWQGQTGNDGAFCIFESMEYGYRAAFRLLHTYNTKYKIYSVREIIYRWAPPYDHNNTSAYIERVCQTAGLKETDLIVVNSWIDEKRYEAIWLVWAMAKVENGNDFITFADMEKVRKGYSLAFGKWKVEKEVKMEVIKGSKKGSRRGRYQLTIHTSCTKCLISPLTPNLTPTLTP